MFIRYEGTPNIKGYQKKASTVFAKGDLCALDANGFLIPATAATTVADQVGIIQRDILATDLDYTATTYVEVDVPIRKLDWFIVDVGTGTPAQTDVGEYVDLDDAKTIDVVAVTIGNVKVEKIPGDGRAVVSFA